MPATAGLGMKSATERLPVCAWSRARAPRRESARVLGQIRSKLVVPGPGGLGGLGASSACCLPAEIIISLRRSRVWPRHTTRNLTSSVTDFNQSSNLHRPTSYLFSHRHPTHRGKDSGIARCTRNPISSARTGDTLSTVTCMSVLCSVRRPLLLLLLLRAMKRHTHSLTFSSTPPPPIDTHRCGAATAASGSAIPRAWTWILLQLPARRIAAWQL
ncbi:uncharacterized protein K452DRAFT_153362 [Aplosporella prunicola CBS 121167]|uniref:Uncharacterized protein n=1 Tax=Aplosporella prunicola CBS 121167 TaxID=1176127 RepID=A0A6A6BJ00_9PEZI|nr:uncharacterized protein K452DRAFT_153362 [Aplosporella prunicola CBS 121167]KAF2144122.1 hypothetical protein K452DRAFT_153362 [Aplosporella prunicola CBS 121167]